jgi:pimeloyl-ACP methyl ester carboxylesterase
MPYANNRGIRIHYEVEGQGPPLVLQHGLSGYLDRWREFGQVEGLKNDYQLVLVDARGHGDSDKPHHTEAYQLELMVGDVVAVLDDLGISKAHYFGYSMGGRIGLGIAKHAHERFHSLILGGASPYRNEAEVQAVAQIRQRLEIAVEKGMGGLGRYPGGGRTHATLDEGSSTG